MALPHHYHAQRRAILILLPPHRTIKFTPIFTPWPLSRHIDRTLSRPMPRLTVLNPGLLRMIQGVVRQALGRPSLVQRAGSAVPKRDRQRRVRGTPCRVPPRVARAVVSGRVRLQRVLGDKGGGVCHS